LFLIKSGAIIYNINKSTLPNYGVFDEKRYFSADDLGNQFFIFEKKRIKFLICEDMWVDELLEKKKQKKVDLIIVINASPYEINKFELRKKMAKKKAVFFNSPLLYVNLVGSQDDLIFDGGSFLMNGLGDIVSKSDFFSDAEFIVDMKNVNQLKPYKEKNKKCENLYRALMIALESYVFKNNFKSVIVGLSGGIDSALCLTLATDVLGPKNVSSFFLPSKFTSTESNEDAKKLSKNLGINLTSLSIESLRLKFSKELSFLFKNFPIDITEENIQSRIRGLLLMAISNKFNSLLVTTGNKSEMAVGYVTLYGDMCGGFALIKDLYKTQVYELAKWRNENFLDSFFVKKAEIIPKNVLKKEPTAELKFNQKDTDLLPAYNVLDKILELLIEKNLDINSIVKNGYNKKLVRKIWMMIKKSEYKRYQSAIGPKVSSMAMDRDRRFPITNNFVI